MGRGNTATAEHGSEAAVVAISEPERGASISRDERGVVLFDRCWGISLGV